MTDPCYPATEALQHALTTDEGASVQQIDAALDEQVARAEKAERVIGLGWTMERIKALVDDCNDYMEAALNNTNRAEKAEAERNALNVQISLHRQPKIETRLVHELKQAEAERDRLKLIIEALDKSELRLTSAGGSWRLSEFMAMMAVIIGEEAPDE